MGFAEGAVQKAKLVMKRASAAGECPKTAVWAAQNIYLSRVGCSAADLFYRRVMSTDLPCLQRKVDFEACVKQRVANQNMPANRKIHESDELVAGQEVDCKNATTKLWDKICRIVKRASDSSKLRLRGESLLRRIVTTEHRQTGPNPSRSYEFNER